MTRRAPVKRCNDMVVSSVADSMRRSRVLRCAWRPRRWSGSQMLLEPIPGELGDPLERAGFFEQVCRVRYDFQALLGVKLTISVAVEPENDRIVAAHDEK